MSCGLDAIGGPDLEKIWSKLPDNMPRHGWRIVRRQDFESFILPNGKHDITKGRLCHMCGVRTRFMYWIGHYDWPVDIAVGATCASYAGCIDTEDLKRKWKDSYEMYRTKGIEAVRTLEEMMLLAKQVEERLMRLEWEAEEAVILQEELRQKALSRRAELLKTQATTIAMIRKIYFSREDFISELMGTIDRLESNWMNGSAWQHTLSGGVSVRCSIRTPFFPADVTLFYQNGLFWNYVLNMPIGDTPLFGKKYPTAIRARDAAYDGLRSAFISLYHTDAHTLMLKCLSNLFNDSVPSQNRSETIKILQDMGIDIEV